MTQAGKNEVEASGQLLHNLVLFGRVLRGLGLDVHTGRAIDLARALQFVELGRRADFFHATRALLVHRREDLPLFDAAFEAFWRRPSGPLTTLDLQAMGEKRRFKRPRFAVPSARNDEPDEAGAGTKPHDDQPPLLRPVLTYSADEVLRHKDFASLTAEERLEVERQIVSLGWRVGERLTRRMRSGDGTRLDLRRTLRRALRSEGEVLRFARLIRRLKDRPVVILADISGSMEAYTRVLLLFAYGVAGHLDRKVEAFVFGTRLTRVTRALRGSDPDQALAAVARSVPDWSGGTRIGETLDNFVQLWARRVLGRGAVVLLISDGWDRGEPAVLREAMARLQRSCHRLIWLNPLLGEADYEPLARGMHTALPFVDDFLPVHNLSSVEELGRRLATLPPQRAARGWRGAVVSKRAVRNERELRAGSEDRPCAS